MIAKTVSERVLKLREEATALGLKRREVYAHEDDWIKIKVYADKLRHKRAKIHEKITHNP